MYRHETVATVYRGVGQESVHHGSIVVVDKTGKIIHYVGDPEFFTQARSEAKPFQAIPLIKTGAADRFGFSDKQLAVMCGSHAGTEDHVRTVKSNLDLIGLDESYLQCGTHPPLYYTVQGILPRADEVFSPLQHNCSGKHSGFLALAQDIGEDPSQYLNPKSRVQQMVFNAVAEMYGYPKDKITIGIDGCSAPVFGMPLKHAAMAFVRLANQISDDPDMARVLGRIKKIITAHPEMVSGEGRFDLALARTFPGNVINKVGAEAIEAIGFSDPPMGIAIKILDGNPRALYPVVIETLRRLGLLDGVDLTHLEPFMNVEITNYRKLIVGKIVPDFELKSP